MSAGVRAKASAGRKCRPPDMSPWCWASSSPWRWARACEDLHARVGHGEPRCPIDFGKRFAATAARRPFDLEGVAADALGVEIAFQREGLDLLAAALPDAAEVLQLAGGRAAQLLGELAARGHRGVLSRDALALGNRPGAEVLATPERPTGMHEENEEPPPVLAAVEKNAGALRRHARPPVQSSRVANPEKPERASR